VKRPQPPLTTPWPAKRYRAILGTPIDEIIGNNLRELRRRERPKITQTDLALVLSGLTLTSWNQQTVSDAEKGKRPFRVVELLMIARVFGVSLIRLLQPWEVTDEAIKFGMKVGMIEYWPDQFIRDHITRPRLDDPDAAKFQMKDDWPDPLGSVGDTLNRLDEIAEFQTTFDFDASDQRFLEEMKQYLDRSGIEKLEKATEMLRQGREQKRQEREQKRRERT
jgi:hypothetical protein